MASMFVPGAGLSRRLYHEVVRPILSARFPDLRHAAPLLGLGSEVLGFDDEMSTDHDWKPGSWSSSPRRTSRAAAPRSVRRWAGTCRKASRDTRSATRCTPSAATSGKSWSWTSTASSSRADPSGPQLPGQLARQSRFGLHEQRGVDRLVRDPHDAVRWEVQHQPPADLLR